MNSLHDDLEDAPPSVKLVYFLLDSPHLDDELTPTEIVDLTALGSDTVRVALRELEDRGLVESEPCLTDRRETLYRPARA